MCSPSFSATAAGALERVLSGSLARDADILRLDVVGGDSFKEGADPKIWLASMEVARRHGYRGLIVSVVGPAMARDEVFRVNDEVTICHARSLYHEWTGHRKPHLALMFHPGLWGYDHWSKTLEMLQGIHLVLTSYTMEEAELDSRELYEALTGRTNDDDIDFSRWQWPPEINPHRSLDLRPTVTAPKGHEYRENAVWQCCF